MHVSNWVILLNKSDKGQSLSGPLSGTGRGLWALFTWELIL